MRLEFLEIEDLGGLLLKESLRVPLLIGRGVGGPSGGGWGLGLI